MSFVHRSSYAGTPSVFGRSGVLALLVLLLMAGVAKSARADVMFTIVDTSDPTNTGTISFPGFSGTDATGVTFSFEGFTEILSLTYSIDPGTDTLLSLSLTANLGPLPCNTSVECEDTTLLLGTTEAATFTLVCEGGFCNGDEESSDNFVRFSPVSTAAVMPEPSCMVLFGSGVLGLWGAVKRRRTF